MEIIKADIKKALKAIKMGKVLVCPTDTVYGLICDAANKKAVEKLYKIKKRPKSKPIPVFVSGIKMAKKLAEISPKQEKFLKKVWPRPQRFASELARIAMRAGREKVTAVLKRRKTVFKIYGVDKTTIALRVPNHKFVLHLVEHIGPLAETSANISGQPASTSVKEALNQFKNQKHHPDLIIKVVRHRMSNRPKASRVVDLTVWPPKILRS